LIGNVYISDRSTKEKFLTYFPTETSSTFGKKQNFRTKKQEKEIESMPDTKTRRQTGSRLSEHSEKAWETCADAATEMSAVLDELEDYPDLYREVAALRAQLGRIEGACQAGRTKGEPQSLPRDDPEAAARLLIARLPLREVFEDKALADAFLSQLLLSLARESSYESRRFRQKKGIEEAKAQGVRFGAPSRPLPDNFEQARRAWRSGELSAQEAAQLCGLGRTTFYNAARRVEETAREAV